MKKLITIILIIFVSATFAQKKLIIYNYTSNPVTIYKILTKPMDTTILAYPYYITSPNITILAGSSYTLENPNSLVKFPLYSPTSIPLINSWFKVSSATSNVNQTALNAWNTMSNKQVFHDVKFSINMGSGNIGELPFGSANLTGPGWNCIYEAIYPIPGNFNLVEYTIVFYQ